MPTRPHPSHRPAPGFSLVEVILALGVMGVAIVSILGLIGATLNDVQRTEDIAAGTATIGEMNALLQNAVFWDATNTDTKDESVYYWVLKSTTNSPTVFLFYNEDTTDSTGGIVPIPRVARFNLNAKELNTPSQSYAINKPSDQNTPQLPVMTSLTSFISAVSNGRVTGSVIAMTLSPSPLMSNFPKAGTIINGVPISEDYYTAPQSGSLFPDSGKLPTDPSGAGGGAIYPEGYFPILVQAFTVPSLNIQSTTDPDTLATQIIGDLGSGNRLYAYNTAKLR